MQLNIQWLNDLLGWNPEGARVSQIMQKRSMPIAERARRRKINKRARASRKRNR